MSIMNFRLLRSAKVYFSIVIPKWSINILSKKKCNHYVILKLKSSLCTKTLSIAYSFSLFGLLKNNEASEDKITTTIKRSILCIQRKQYDKAEQMLHLALRMAQDIQSRDGVTYVYDLMANLAMDREQFKKAETLFAHVMRRLLEDGVPNDSLKILHMSAKIAHMAQLQGDIKKARIGFSWTLAKIDECKKKMPEDNDVKELWALTTNWFGELLMQENNFKHAKQCFEDAYDCLVQMHGNESEEAVTILNNLGVACSNMDNFDDARRYISKALDILRTIKDASQEGILLANLGLIYLREGLIKEARNSCSQAWKSGKNQSNGSAIKQAEYCLHKIKETLKE